MNWLLRNLSVAFVVLATALGAAVVMQITPNDLRALSEQQATRLIVWTDRQIATLTGERDEAVVASAPAPGVFTVAVEPMARPEPTSGLIPVPDTFVLGGQIIQSAFLARMQQRPELTPVPPGVDTPSLAGPSDLSPLRGGLDGAVRHPVVDRMLAQLPIEIVAHFDLFLYVSKSDEGPWAQQMFVLSKGKTESGLVTLTLLHQWFVSTGREAEELNARGEMMSTATPVGIFKLDPDRFYYRYWSSQWQSQMPWTMFFDYQTNGLPTGLAIHGTVPETQADLGRRSSAGCIRLAPENAKALYRLVRRNYAGLVPRFKIDRSGTMSSEGIVLHNRNGRTQMEQGLRVIVFIDNFNGEDAVIATLF